MKIPASLLILSAALGLATFAHAQAPAAKPKKAANDPDAGKRVNENKATPPERIKVMKDFKIELLYSVPIEEQGSWVAMCVDNKGRLIVSDQYGSLYRFAPPAPGQPLDPSTIQRIPAPIKAANGLLWAFDALWVGVNDYENPDNGGLYRVTSSHHDDQLDTVEKLRPMQGRGDHGVHAVLPGPDGKSVFLITGDGTTPTEFNRSRVPLHWGEDHLLPRMPDGRGFMRNVLAPGGIIYKISADGKDWEVWSSGFRNIYDAAFDKSGELFTYDADMEYDFNTPWYRPTRICHCVSGAEFGWRNGAGKWAEWYPDNLPPVLNVGPGSPTGMIFGYGAKFPAKYQNALFCLDWSWGRLYAVHLHPKGASFTATKEDFLNGAPLPMTDVVINPADGAMYFTIGGRKVQSGLYRVTYTGSESTAPAPAPTEGEAARTARHELEAYHHEDTGALAAAWPKLGDSDRFIRWAARTAVEQQPVNTWADKALAESDPAKQVEALLALARCAGIDPFHRQPNDPPVDTAMRAKLLTALQKIDWAALNNEQRITLVRTLQIALNRFGRPDDATVQALLAKFDPVFPAPTYELNRLLCEALVYLQSSTVAAKAVPMLEQAPTQEEQMEYARSLRMLKTGWTTPLHTAYFEWFLKAANYRGGASFEKFIEFIRNDAVASLSDSEKTELAAELDKKPVLKSPLEAAATALAGHTTITPWTLEQIDPPAELKGRNFETGHKLFAAVGCSACHRFGNEGGMTGPDLTQAGGRYSARDLIDNIVNPSKEINEQFVPTVITLLDDTQHIGMIVNLNSDFVSLNTDPTQPNQQERIDRKKVKSIEPSKVSLMPPGLLNILSKDEIFDLAAYVLSGGDPKSPMFTQH
ncbi:MAG: c-type cytochrome [Chthoniobacter sp.]|nr:c-type cytochrome [Chthoniobacter sp.]